MSKRICYDNMMLHLRVYLCFSQDQLDDIRKHYNIKEEIDWCPSGVGCTKSIITPEKSQVHVMCINKKGRDTKKSLLITLVHESVHVWQYHKQFIGETADCWEIEAYFISDIVAQFSLKVLGKI